MKTILTAILVVPFLFFRVQAQNDLTRRCKNTYQNKQYEFVVLQSDLDAAPLWLDNEENPPLSVRAAVARAQELAKKIPNSGDWRVSTVILERSGSKAGQWICIVEFTTYHGAAILLGPGNRFQIPVLLNGKVPELNTKSARNT